MKIGDGFTSPNLVETAQEKYPRKIREFEDVEMFPEPVPPFLVCKKCGRERIISNFPRSKHSKVGHMRVCTDCFGDMTRERKPWLKAAQARKEKAEKMQALEAEEVEKVLGPPITKPEEAFHPEKAYRKRGAVRGVIMEAFQNNPNKVWTVAEIRDLLPEGVPVGTTSSSLTQLKKQGKIVHLGTNGWTLATGVPTSPTEELVWRRVTEEDGAEVTRSLVEQDGVLWMVTVKMTRTRVE